MTIVRYMLEREHVTALVTDLLERSRGGAGGTLFVAGEAGLGKTTVLERAGEEASGSHHVASARGDLMESALPFGFVAQVLDALGGQDILDVTDPAPAADARAARFFKVQRWLEGVAREPALLLLDDLQWADADSIGFLSFLARRISRLPVAVIASVRPWPR